MCIRDRGFGSCELNYSEKRFTKELAEQVKAASKKHRIRVTTLVGVPGSKSTWNFRQGPATIGLVPTDERSEKLDVYRKMIDFCVQAGIPAMHSHFGFIPEDPSSVQYKDFIAVMRGLATYAKERNVMIYFETGQETPITLIRAIRDIGTGNLFINCELAKDVYKRQITDYPIYQDYGSWQGWNPVDQVVGNRYLKTRRRNLNGIVSFNINLDFITKGLSTKVMASYLEMCIRDSVDSINDSWLIRHAADTEGKKPQRLPSGKRVLPS